jgi:transcriptional regulatory protein RtcR
MPGLRERGEDIEPNLDYELDQFARKSGRRVTFNKEARRRFLDFATSPAAIWQANFRDLNGAVTRMATLAPGGRITVEEVKEETHRLHADWKAAERGYERREDLVARYLPESVRSRIDPFDLTQLAEVLRVCTTSRSLSEAGRRLFAVSRLTKKTVNDADRLRKYLARFDLKWSNIVSA